MSTVKKKFIITGMHCVSCALTIDGDLEDTKGVKSASTNYAKQETAVEFDPTVISDESIIGIIKKSGYTAQPLPQK